MPGKSGLDTVKGWGGERFLLSANSRPRERNGVLCDFIETAQARIDALAVREETGARVAVVG
jgi:hypothetical protein